MGGKTFAAELTKEKATKTYKLVIDETVDLTANSNIVFSIGVNDTVLLDNIRLEEDALIKNGSFNADFAGFEVYAYTPSDVSYTVDSQKEDHAFDITIKNTGDQDWHIQLKQNNVVLEKGQWYRLTFDAKSSVNRAISYAIQRNGAVHKDAAGNEDWTPYVQKKANLTSEYQTIDVSFKMKEATDEGSIFNIAMGAVGGDVISTQHRICIDNIKLEKIDEPKQDPSETEGAEMIKNGNFADGLNDWEKAITAPGAADVTVSDNSIVYDITNVGIADWNVQLKQSGITLEPEKKYVAKFKATSTEARTIKLAFLTASYDWYGGADIKLPANEEKEVEITFTVPGDKEKDDNITMVVSMGVIEGNDTLVSTISLSDFSLQKQN